MDLTSCGQASPPRQIWHTDLHAWAFELLQNGNVFLNFFKLWIVRWQRSSVLKIAFTPTHPWPPRTISVFIFFTAYCVPPVFHPLVPFIYLLLHYFYSVSYIFSILVHFSFCNEVYAVCTFFSLALTFYNCSVSSYPLFYKLQHGLTL